VGGQVLHAWPLSERSSEGSRAAASCASVLSPSREVGRCAAHARGQRTVDGCCARYGWSRAALGRVCARAVAYRGDESFYSREETRTWRRLRGAAARKTRAFADGSRAAYVASRVRARSRAWGVTCGAWPVGRDLLGGSCEDDVLLDSRLLLSLVPLSIHPWSRALAGRIRQLACSTFLVGGRVSCPEARRG
jgi:hypothetical protein